MRIFIVAIVATFLSLFFWQQPEMVEDPAPGIPTITEIDLETGGRTDWVPM